MKRSFLLAVLAAVAAIFLVVVPAGAAPAAKDTVIVDPVDASDKARVENGKLQIGGAVELTGPVTISGSVDVQPAVPERPFLYTGLARAGIAPGTLFYAFGPVSGDEKLAITSFTVTNRSFEEPARVVLSPVAVDPTAPGCFPIKSPSGFLELRAPVGESAHASYPTPVVMPFDDFERWCLQVIASGDDGLYPLLTLVGFRP